MESFETRLNDLQKLTISRLKSDFTWGIDFPLDDDHIVYVWFDALLNYITGHNSLYDEMTRAFTTHIIGKDIVWFHSVIYPAILDASNLPQYNEIYVHGFIVDNEGRKMSKSLGNVVLPEELFAKYTVDQIRFYMFYETRLGEDLKFSEERIVQVYNEILVGKFLNMFQRVYKLISDIDYPFSETKMIYFECGGIDILTGLQTCITDTLHKCNDMLSEDKPWRMSKEEKYEYFSSSFGERFYSAMCMMYCVIPDKVKELNEKMGMNIPSLPISSYNYDPLYKSFKKIDSNR